ncbi:MULTISPECIES: hypothetical protein [Rothia]|uniref:Uncharacterized protein n=1 Tax=Rothia nasimurium TaxID=85336 RepID=A0A1Y1RSK1_9MICC|nr:MULTISPECIES: hypothetical protein [Rothia]ORC22608.1 hypothetical protein A7979_10645 [Rothia nasimurium]
MSTITTVQDLTEALSRGDTALDISGRISGMPSLKLPAGTTLRGITDDAELHFGAKGLQLTANNTVAHLAVTTSPQELAIFNSDQVEDFGTLRLENITTVGQIYLTAAGANRAGRFETDGVHVREADVRGRTLRPHGFGVDALQGAFTAWNLQRDKEVVITAELLGVSAGTETTPVRGSGVFVGGQGTWEGQPEGGTLHISQLTTGDIYTDGGIAPGTPDLISGGVFLMYGGIADRVINHGSTTTYGQNDMVLDNWGQATEWISEGRVTSHGPSGIGFVNFGGIDTLDIRQPILTTGRGARGFNLYDGYLKRAIFDSIATTGDGSIGIQVSKPLPSLTVRRDLTTVGGEGLSLVRGMQVTLQAIALSIQDGGVLESLEVGGEISTSGDNVPAVESLGEVRAFAASAIRANGAGADAVRATAGSLPVDGLALYARDGKKLAEQ